MVERRFLNGMDEISRFTGFSPNTLRKHKRQYPGMPIRKLENGTWIANRELLERFYQDLATGRTEHWLQG
jgi:hypothetical protein